MSDLDLDTADTHSRRLPVRIGVIHLHPYPALLSVLSPGTRYITITNRNCTAVTVAWQPSLTQKSKHILPVSELFLRTANAQVFISTSIFFFHQIRRFSARVQPLRWVCVCLLKEHSQYQSSLIWIMHGVYIPVVNTDMPTVTGQLYLLRKTVKSCMVLRKYRNELCVAGGKKIHRGTFHRGGLISPWKLRERTLWPEKRKE